MIIEYNNIHNDAEFDPDGNAPIAWISERPGVPVFEIHSVKMIEVNKKAAEKALKLLDEVFKA